MREFRKTTGRSKRPNIWTIKTDESSPDTYIIEWGLLDGAMQKTSNTPGDCGVEGHSDYQTPEEYVEFCIKRDIRKKEEQGYVEYINGEPSKEMASEIDFNELLPKNLSFYKPKKEISDKKLAKLHVKGRILWGLKRDGMCHIAVKSSGVWSIYTRRMDLATEKFPHIVRTLQGLDIPNNTILLGEMVFTNENGTDDFKKVSKICRSDEDLSLAYQGFGEFPKNKKDAEVQGPLSFYIFDIPFYDSVNLIQSVTFTPRLERIYEICAQLNHKLLLDSFGCLSRQRRSLSLLLSHYVGPMQVYNVNPETDINLAKEMKIEGWVIIDKEANYGDKAFSFDGKAQRPDGVWKRKPKYDEEFVITGIYEGSGRNQGKLGGFNIAQYHPETGDQIDCGKCGGGFSDEQREEFYTEDLIGRTIKVEFDSRQPPKGGVYALRFPVFYGFSDKTREECIAQYI